jgi:hypothetical protein
MNHLTSLSLASENEEVAYMQNKTKKILIII